MSEHEASKKTHKRNGNKSKRKQTTPKSTTTTKETEGTTKETESSAECDAAQGTKTRVSNIITTNTTNPTTSQEDGTGTIINTTKSTLISNKRNNNNNSVATQFSVQSSDVDGLRMRISAIRPLNHSQLSSPSSSTTTTTKQSTHSQLILPSFYCDSSKNDVTTETNASPTTQHNWNSSTSLKNINSKYSKDLTSIKVENNNNNDNSKTKTNKNTTNNRKREESHINLNTTNDGNSPTSCSSSLIVKIVKSHQLKQQLDKFAREEREIEAKAMPVTTTTSVDAGETTITSYTCPIRTPTLIVTTATPATTIKRLKSAYKYTVSDKTEAAGSEATSIIRRDSINIHESNAQPTTSNRRLKIKRRKEHPHDSKKCPKKIRLQMCESSKAINDKDIKSKTCQLIKNSNFPTFTSDSEDEPLLYRQNQQIQKQQKQQQLDTRAPRLLLTAINSNKPLMMGFKSSFCLATANQTFSTPSSTTTSFGLTNNTMGSQLSLGGSDNIGLSSSDNELPQLVSAAIKRVEENNSETDEDENLLLHKQHQLQQKQQIYLKIHNNSNDPSDFKYEVGRSSKRLKNKERRQSRNCDISRSSHHKKNNSYTNKNNNDDNIRPQYQSSLLQDFMEKTQSLGQNATIFTPIAADPSIASPELPTDITATTPNPTITTTNESKPVKKRRGRPKKIHATTTPVITMKPIEIIKSHINESGDSGVISTTSTTQSNTPSPQRHNNNNSNNAASWTSSVFVTTAPQKYRSGKKRIELSSCLLSSSTNSSSSAKPSPITTTTATSETPTKFDIAYLEKRMYATERVLYPPPRNKRPTNPISMKKSTTCAAATKITTINSLIEDSQIDPVWRKIDVNKKFRRPNLSGYKSDGGAAERNNGGTAICSKILAAKSGYVSDYGGRTHHNHHHHHSMNNNNNSGYKSDAGSCKSRYSTKSCVSRRSSRRSRRRRFQSISRPSVPTTDTKDEQDILQLAGLSLGNSSEESNEYVCKPNLASLPETSVSKKYGEINRYIATGEYFGGRSNVNHNLMNFSNLATFATIGGQLKCPRYDEDGNSMQNRDNATSSGNAVVLPRKLKSRRSSAASVCSSYYSCTSRFKRRHRQRRHSSRYFNSTSNSGYTVDSKLLTEIDILTSKLHNIKVSSTMSSNNSGPGGEMRNENTANNYNNHDKILNNLIINAKQHSKHRQKHKRNNKLHEQQLDLALLANNVNNNNSNANNNNHSVINSNDKDSINSDNMHKNDGNYYQNKSNLNNANNDDKNNNDNNHVVENNNNDDISNNISNALGVANCSQLSTISTTTSATNSSGSSGSKRRHKKTNSSNSSSPDDHKLPLKKRHYLLSGPGDKTNTDAAAAAAAAVAAKLYATNAEAWAAAAAAAKTTACTKAQLQFSAKVAAKAAALTPKKRHLLQTTTTTNKNNTTTNLLDEYHNKNTLTLNVNGNKNYNSHHYPHNHHPKQHENPMTTKSTSVLQKSLTRIIEENSSSSTATSSSVSFPPPPGVFEPSVELEIQIPPINAKLSEITKSEVESPLLLYSCTGGTNVTNAASTTTQSSATINSTSSTTTNPRSEITRTVVESLLNKTGGNLLLKRKRKKINRTGFPTIRRKKRKINEQLLLDVTPDISEQVQQLQQQMLQQQQIMNATIAKSNEKVEKTINIPEATPTHQPRVSVVALERLQGVPLPLSPTLKKFTTTPILLASKTAVSPALRATKKSGRKQKNQEVTEPRLEDVDVGVTTKLVARSSRCRKSTTTRTLTNTQDNNLAKIKEEEPINNLSTIPENATPTVTPTITKTGSQETPTAAKQASESSVIKKETANKFTAATTTHICKLPSRVKLPAGIDPNTNFCCKIRLKRGSVLSNKIMTETTAIAATTRTTNDGNTTTKQVVDDKQINSNIDLEAATKDIEVEYDEHEPLPLNEQQLGLVEVIQEQRNVVSIDDDRLPINRKTATTATIANRVKKHFLIAGLFSDFYKNNSSKTIPTNTNALTTTTSSTRLKNTLSTLLNSNDRSFLLPSPIYCENYLRRTQLDFELPYDIWLAYKNCKLPTRITVPSWNYRKIRTNIYAESMRPNTTGIDHPTCNCKEDMACGDSCLNRMVYTECSPSSCPAGDRCCNQKIQRHEVSPGVERFMTANKGWGVRTKVAIKKGTYILEYVGEVVTEREFKHRMATIYLNDIHHYCLHLDGGLVIDGHRMGSDGRFVNHSCQPNCEMQKWSVNGLSRMALFAKRNITPGEELSYDYNFALFNPSEGQPCRCMATQCRGVIGGKSQRVKPLPIENNTKLIDGKNNKEAVNSRARKRKASKNTICMQAKDVVVALNQQLSDKERKMVKQQHIFLTRIYDKVRERKLLKQKMKQNPKIIAPTIQETTTITPSTSNNNSNCYTLKKEEVSQQLQVELIKANRPTTPSTTVTVQMSALCSARTVKTRGVTLAGQDPNVERMAKMALIFREICTTLELPKDANDEQIEPLAKRSRKSVASTATASPTTVQTTSLDVRLILDNIDQGCYREPDQFDDDMMKLFNETRGINDNNNTIFQNNNNEQKQQLQIQEKEEAENLNSLDFLLAAYEAQKYAHFEQLLELMGDEKFLEKFRPHDNQKNKQQTIKASETIKETVKVKIQEYANKLIDNEYKDKSKHPSGLPTGLNVGVHKVTKTFDEKSTETTETPTVKELNCVKTIVPPQPISTAHMHGNRKVIIRGMKKKLSGKKTATTATAEDIIRCICGMYKDEGLMIQCAQCMVWQHAECTRADINAENYLCERCDTTRHVDYEIQLDDYTEDGHRYYLTLMRGTLHVRQGDAVYVLRDIPMRDEDGNVVPSKKHTYETIGNIDYQECDIFRVERLWKSNAGQRFIFGHHFLRPHETFHEPTRRFYPNEVVRVPLYEVVPIELVIGRCWVLDRTTFCKGRPAECNDEAHCYICELRVDKSARFFSKAKINYPTCTKSFAFRKFPERLKISKTYAPHDVDASLLKSKKQKNDGDITVATIKEVAETSDQKGEYKHIEKEKENAQPNTGSNVKKLQETQIPIDDLKKKSTRLESVLDNIRSQVTVTSANQIIVKTNKTASHKTNNNNSKQTSSKNLGENKKKKTNKKQITITSKINKTAATKKTSTNRNTRQRRNLKKEQHKRQSTSKHNQNKNTLENVKQQQLQTNARYEPKTILNAPTRITSFSTSNSELVPNVSKTPEKGKIAHRNTTTTATTTPNPTITSISQEKQTITKINNNEVNSKTIITTASALATSVDKSTTTTAGDVELSSVITTTNAMTMTAKALAPSLVSSVSEIRKKAKSNTTTTTSGGTKTAGAKSTTIITTVTATTNTKMGETVTSSDNSSSSKKSLSSSRARSTPTTITPITTTNGSTTAKTTNPKTTSENKL